MIRRRRRAGSEICRDGPSRDQAVSAFTNRIRSSDPSAAVQWAATIGDDSLRNSQMESTARAWLKADPRNASAWISNSSLPDDTKTRLLNPGGTEIGCRGGRVARWGRRRQPRTAPVSEQPSLWPARPPLHESAICSIEHVASRLISRRVPSKQSTAERAKELARIFAILHKWGVHTLGDLAALQPEPLGARLGPTAVRLWEQATGRATRLLRLVRPAEVFREEARIRLRDRNRGAASVCPAAISRATHACVSARFISSRRNSLSASPLRTNRTTSIAFTFPTRPTRWRFCSASSRPISKLSGPNIRSWRFPWRRRSPSRPGNNFIFSRRRYATRAGSTKHSPGSRDC